MSAEIVELSHEERVLFACLELLSQDVFEGQAEVIIDGDEIAMVSDGRRYSVDRFGQPAFVQVL